MSWSGPCILKKKTLIIFQRIYKKLENYHSLCNLISGIALSLKSFEAWREWQPTYLIYFCERSSYFQRFLVCNILYVKSITSETYQLVKHWVFLLALKQTSCSGNDSFHLRDAHRDNRTAASVKIVCTFNNTNTIFNLLTYTPESR